MGENDEIRNNLPSPPPLDAETPSPGGGAAEPTFADDGLDADERAAFDAMREGAEVPTLSIDNDRGADTGTGDKPAKPAPKKAAASDAAAANADGAEGDDGDDDAEDDDAEGDGAEGHEQRQEQRRINFQKHKRLLKKRDDQIAALNTKLQEQAIRDAKLNERLAILDEALRTPPKPQGEAEGNDDPEPPEDDVYATVAWQKRQLARMAKTVNDLQSGFKQTTEADANERSFRQYYSQDVQAFRSSDPNFDEAYTFLMLSRDRELAAIGYADQNVRHEMIRKDERGIITRAMNEWRQTGVPVSAAKRLMDLAKARGYRPGILAKQPSGDGDADAAGAANGGAKPAPAANGGKPAPKPAAKPSVADEVRNMREAREANMSLSDVGGISAPTLTTETLAKLSDDEFGELMDNLPRERFMDLMGR